MRHESRDLQSALVPLHAILTFSFVGIVRKYEITNVNKTLNFSMATGQSETSDSARGRCRISQCVFYVMHLLIGAKIGLLNTFFSLVQKHLCSPGLKHCLNV